MLSILPDGASVNQREGSVCFAPACLVIAACLCSPASTLAAQTEIVQWAAGATASSQYGSSNWSASQATGAANTTRCGDTTTAWAPRSNGNNPEWIELIYNQPVHATQIRVHETFMSGFIYQIEFRDTRGQLHPAWVSSGVGDTTPCPGWFERQIPRTSYVVKAVRIHTKTSGWEEIDAVQLKGQLNVGGTVSGISPTFVKCENVTTGATVQIPLAGTKFWSCTEAGLAIRRGDQVRELVNGVAE